MMYEGDPPVGKLSLVFRSSPIIHIPGPWKLEWQPEDASSMSLPLPTEAPQACLTVDSWQSALSNPQPLPATLTGKVSIYGRIAEDGQKPTPENYGVYVFDLDGSDKQVIGSGVWPSLSPDGTQIAYAVSDDGLHIVDLASGENHRIPNTQNDDNVPRWSRDGKQIAFMRMKDFNLYTMNPDGTDVKQILDGIDYEELIGWSANGASLFYGANTQDGVMLKQLDIVSGAIKELFTVKSSGLEASLSPDVTRFAFMDQAGNESSYGMYTAALDGSDRQLVGQMGHWLVMRPVWSPDGNWLLVGILNTDDSSSESVAAAVNLQTCQIVPLPLSGDISSWVP
jgi:Tol biopolymer transport system component